VSETTRDRILEAALGCIDADGLAATSLEDVARAASVSRATIYRQFPGGREQLVSETITWEVARFFGRIEEAIADAPDLGAKLAVALVTGHRAIVEHRLLQRLLRSEPEALLPEIQSATEAIAGIVVLLIADELRSGIAAGRVRAGIDVNGTADHLARLFLSYLGAAGQWDLDDRAEVDRLVCTQFLVGVAPD
jgi:AcrR family transcriptional regulator